MYTRAVKLLVLCVCASLCQAAEDPGAKLGADLRSLSGAYGRALECLSEEDWPAAVRLLELSVRLHRVLIHSVAFCSQTCGENSANKPEAPQGLSEHTPVYWHILQRAACVKACRARFPELDFSLPRKEILHDFKRRLPYKYLHVAYGQLNDSQRAASAAQTYLQRNPGDAVMATIVSRYRNTLGLKEPEDLEEQPYERLFLQSVFLFNGGEFSRSVTLMEEALLGYLQEFKLCSATCGAILDSPQPGHIYISVADVYTEMVKCTVKCEEALRPCVGGVFVEKFLATIYHYLQFSYYKLGDIIRAVPCAVSYLLFDPEDEVMKDNIKVYLTNQEEWGLQHHHYAARPEAVKYFNLISSQRAMLTFSQLHLQSGDEGELEGPDVEFSGLSRREEPLIAHWDSPARSRGDQGVSED